MQQEHCTMPVYAFNDFLLIVNAYGAFLKEREVFKKISTKIFPSEFKSFLRSYIIDYYDEHSTGLERSEFNAIIDQVKYILNKEEALMLENLISTEKYYKKLKHQFRKKYPELIEQFDSVLKEHQNFYQETKQSQYHKHNSLLKLNERFIAFFQYTFGGSDGQKLAYRRFSLVILKKYKIQFDKEELNKLEILLDSEFYGKKLPKLNLKQIDFIADILKQIINNVTEEDLNNTSAYVNSISNGNMPLNEKEETARQIINKEFKRFIKLYSEYEELSSKANQVL